MQSMRRFFVPGPSTISAFDNANRHSLPRKGVAALPYAEWVPAQSALRFLDGRSPKRCPDFSKHRQQGREFALIQVRTA